MFRSLSELRSMVFQIEKQTVKDKEQRLIQDIEYQCKPLFEKIDKELVETAELGHANGCIVIDDKDMSNFLNMCDDYSMGGPYVIAKIYKNRGFEVKIVTINVFKMRWK